MHLSKKKGFRKVKEKEDKGKFNVLNNFKWYKRVEKEKELAQTREDFIKKFGKPKDEEKMRCKE